MTPQAATLPTPRSPDDRDHVAGPAIDEHLVQFYDSEPFLCDAVARFLALGIAAGEPLVVVATEEHRAAFLRRLADEGLDVGVAQGTGRLVLLDARETLGAL